MPSLERTLVRQFEMPGETDRVSLDRMCSSYGFVASKFLFAFQTRELRGEVRDFRAFRNRLVAALGKKPVEFNHKLADLRTNGKAAEASLLTLLREIKETSGPHLQARHWKLALEETSKCSRCGYHGHADLVAALNILGRLGDKEIRIGMPPSRVKAVLDGRYVGWKSLNHTVSDKTSGVARVVNESPRSASSKSELRSNVQVCIASR